jgi:hypothetical protein
MKDKHMEKPVTPVEVISNGELVVEKPGALVQAWPASLPVTYTPEHTWADVAWRTMDGGASLLGFLWKLCKLAICIGLDIFDFTFGRILGFGIAVDVGSALIAMALWGMGWRSLWSVPELFDLSEQIDGFLPSCTFIALAAWRNN